MKLALSRLAGALGLAGLLAALNSGGEPVPLVPAAIAQVFTDPAPKPRATQPATRPRPRPTASTPARTAPTTAPQPRRQPLNDPVPYCAAHPDSELIGADYTGQPLPDWVARAATPQGGPGGQSLAFNWRCMNGRVLACGGKSEDEACAKPTTSTEPTAELQQFCKNAGKRNVTVPASIVGNTVPIWMCRRGQPVVTGYRSGIDAHGYFSDQWHDVTDYSPRNMVGAIPRSFVGSWEVGARSSGLLGFQYRIFVAFTGGPASNAIGQADYYQLNTSDQQMLRLCSTTLHLRGNNPRVLELEERYSFRSPNIACPVQGQMTAQHRDGRLLVEWRRAKDGKITLSGWGQRN